MHARHVQVCSGPLRLLCSRVPVRNRGLLIIAERSGELLCKVAACTPPEQPMITPWQAYQALEAVRWDVQQALRNLLPAGEI